MRRLTVLQILPALASGGVERGTLEVAAYLVQAGHRSLVMSAGGRMVSALEAAGSTHITWPIGHKSLWSLRLIRRLRQLWRDEQVDIVHVRSRFPAWLVYLAWRGMPADCRPRLVTTVHGRYRENAYSRVMTFGERVIVISHMIETYAKQAYQVADDRLRLIYRGVSPLEYPQGYQPEAVWKQAWYAQYPATLGKRILLLPARMTAWKGHADFIALMRFVSQHRADVHALMVGEIDPRKTAYTHTITQQIAAAGLEHCITVTGHRSDLKQILGIADIVYSLSTTPEAFGRTTLEALTMGKPVIGYGHGGVAEQLAQMLPEGAVEVGNVVEASLLTLYWLTTPPTILDNQRFTLGTMLAQTLQVYEEVMALPKGDACISQ